MTLLNRARQVDEKALVAQRLKRFPSIYKKLGDNPNMKLSQMQDIGGCRAILASVEHVDKVVSGYMDAEAKNPEGRPVLDDFDDYITHPKPDGYRSIHLIYKYRSKSASKVLFNGQRIEVQIRSRLQHAWATAVEVAQTFTGQALKSKVKDGKETWLRFFALMGTAIANRENRPIVPSTPEEKEDLIKELVELEKQEQIISCLSGWGTAIEQVKRKSEDAHTFILELVSRYRRR
jgi:hypothetical protein